MTMAPLVNEIEIHQTISIMNYKTKFKTLMLMNRWTTLIRELWDRNSAVVLKQWNKECYFMLITITGTRIRIKKSVSVFFFVEYL